MTDLNQVSDDSPVTPEPFAAHSYLDANASRSPDAVAVWQGGIETTFGRLRDVVWALIDELRRRAIGNGSVVAVALPNVLEYVALEIAVPATGAVLFPLPMGIGDRELASVLQRSGAALLITEGSPRGEAFAQVAAGLERPPAVVPADELQCAAQAAPRVSGPATAPADPDRIVQIALTSGTTGMPKLASLSARLKQMTFEGFTRRLRITAADRMFPMSPMTQGAGEMCMYALRCGATLVMLGDHRFEPEAALSIAEQSSTTVLGGVPTMLVRLLHSPALPITALHGVRLTISAGALLPRSVAREWEQRTGSRVGSFYGAMDVGQLAVPDPEDPARQRWTSVGRPHGAAQWRICGPDGSTLGIGQTGGICMRGPLVQDRYWDDDSTPYSADGWAHFGDLGFVDAEGFLHITGRIKDTIIRGGNNINPLEVEELLREHPRIRDVCVVGRPDPELGERAVAFVAPAAGQQVLLEDLVMFLDEQGLTRHKWPERVELVENLPTGPTGKVDRKALRARAAELKMEAPRLMKLRANGISMRYWEIGEGDPVVLIHGLADDHRAWRRVIGRLMLDRRVIAYNLRGHGGTELGDADGTLAQLAADLLSLCEALKLSGPVLAGFSLGGTIAMRAALDAPDQIGPIALIATSSRVGRAAREWYAERARLVDSSDAGLRATLDADTADVYRVRPEEVAAGLQIRRSATADPRGYANACRAMAGLGEHPLDDELAAIVAPTVVLAGDLDQHCPPRAAEIIASRIGGSRLTLLPDCGHPLPIECPDEVTAAIRELSTAAAAR